MTECDELIDLDEIEILYKKRLDRCSFNIEFELSKKFLHEKTGSF
jgi:hypothetical protein